MVYNPSSSENENPSVYEAPGALALLAGQSVKDRIWVFLYESLNRDIREGRKKVSIFNEVDFYNICQ